MLQVVRKLAVCAALVGALSGCAVYHAAPLPAAPDLTAAPAGPLDMVGAARLALEKSPDLIALRRKAQVTEAQAHASGLLPDPQFSASADRPTVHGPDLVTGYALGLSQDLQALLTAPSRAEGAKAQVAEAELNLLWGEWQTIQNTASVFARAVYADRKARLLRKTAGILSAQAARSGRALAAHNSTIDVAGSDLSAALDTASQADAAARDSLDANSQLKGLLAFVPDTTLTLTEPGTPAIISRKDVKAALKRLPKTRPDLLALQAGYHAQEEAVWSAILEQFPAVNVGFSRAADTSNIQTNGLSVTVNIPIFGSTQAKIRTERATRAQLRAEYQARLDSTTVDAWRIWHAIGLLREQIARLSARLPQFHEMAATAQKAYAAGNLSPSTYVLMQTSLSARDSELLDLKATLWADSLALKVLLAMPLIAPGDGETSS